MKNVLVVAPYPDDETLDCKTLPLVRLLTALMRERGYNVLSFSVVVVRERSLD